MSACILALDIGTQSARAAVVTRDGAIAGIEQVPHEVDSPQPGWAQQRPRAWWEETCQAIRRVVRETGTDPASIAAVATCGQMHGPVGIDDEGRVTTEWVQLWCDKRCTDQCEQVRAAHDESALAAVAVVTSRNRPRSCPGPGQCIHQNFARGHSVRSEYVPGHNLSVIVHPRTKPFYLSTEHGLLREK